MSLKPNQIITRMIKVDEGGNITRYTAVEVEATLDSFLQIFCPLPKARQRRSETQPIDTHIAYGYKIAVSNNGQHFSKEDTLVIFDTTCVDCLKYNGTIFCTAKVNNVRIMVENVVL